jgi:PST family polysaccharide transporter
MINLLVGIGAIAILARIFTPTEYGQFGILTLIVTICNALPTAIGQSFIHEGSDDASAFASYVWIFCATLLATVLALLLLEPALVGFFAGSLPRGEFHWLYLVVPLASLSAFLDAKLSKAHRFEVLAAGEMALQIGGAVLVTIALSFYLPGIEALVVGTASGFAGKVLIQAWALGCPPPLRNVDQLSRRLRSVGQFAAIHGANYFGLYGDNLVVARLLGPTDLGIYGRAYNLMSKPVTTLSGFITSVYFPLMVSARDNDVAFRSGYLKALAFAALVGIPLSTYLFLVSTDIVAVLLGQTWQAAALPFAVLSVACYFRLSYRITETVSLARTTPASSFGRQSLYAILVVTGAALGAQWGIVGVAAAVVTALALFFLFSLIKANRTADCAMSSCLKLLTPAAAGTLVSALLTLGVWELFGSVLSTYRLFQSTFFWGCYGLYWSAICLYYPEEITAKLLRQAVRRSGALFPSLK